MFVEKTSFTKAVLIPLAKVLGLFDCLWEVVWVLAMVLNI